MVNFIFIIGPLSPPRTSKSSYMLLYNMIMLAICKWHAGSWGGKTSNLVKTYFGAYETGLEQPSINNQTLLCMGKPLFNTERLEVCLLFAHAFIIKRAIQKSTVKSCID